MKAKPALAARVDDGTGAFPRVPMRIRHRAIAFPLEGKNSTCQNRCRPWKAFACIGPEAGRGFLETDDRSRMDEQFSGEHSSGKKREADLR
jgi:hypothetical protein